MYLSRFGVKNYKCLGEIDIPLTPIHVIIGENDSTFIVDTEDTPWSVAVNPNTNEIYVGNSIRDSVTVIDGEADSVTATISVGDSPMAIAVNP